MNSNQMILDAVRRYRDEADRTRTEAAMTHAACKAKHELWNKMNPDDGVGGMSMNPYNPEHAQQKARESLEEYLAWQRAYDHAIMNFLDDES